MPRKYTTKEGSKKRKPVDKEKLKTAVAAVLDGNTLKGTSKKYGVPVMTLKRYARRQKESKEEIEYAPNYKKSQILTDKEEKDLATHLETASKSYGFTPKKIRTLAYQFVKRNNKKIPANWEAKKEASYDWFWGFMQRHKILQSNAPSLSRATKEELSSAPTLDQQDQMIGPRQLQPQQQIQQPQQQKQQPQPQKQQLQPQKQQPQPQKQQPQQQQPKQLRVYSYNKTFDAQPGPSTTVLEEQDDDNDDSGFKVSAPGAPEGPHGRPLDLCRFCAEYCKDCVDVTNQDRPYLTRNKTALILNDLSVELDFNNDALPKTVCGICDRKLQAMYDFFKQVKEAQESLIKVDVKEEIEAVIVKTECESPMPKDEDDVDEIDSKDGIIDSLTVVVKPYCNKRKNVKAAPKTQKKPKFASKDIKSEETELIIDIKEEIPETVNAYEDYEAENPDNDTEPDVKPSVSGLASDLANEMSDSETFS